MSTETEYPDTSADRPTSLTRAWWWGIIAAGITIEALLLAQFWAWFVAPLGIHRLHAPQAAGLSLIVFLLRIPLVVGKDSSAPPATLRGNVTLAANMAMAYGVTLLLGGIYRLMMLWVGAP